MGRDMKIIRITETQYRYEIENMAMEETLGFDRIYKAGSRLELVEEIVSIETDAGITGSEVGGVDATSAGYLLGRNPLDREAIWRDLKRAKRMDSGTFPSALDIALWDIAGKLYDAPLYELLGGAWRKKIPCYASTYHGDENGGLTTPEDFAQFALQCKRQYGYPAFKIHGWINGPIEREVAAVLAIRAAVGDDMDLMLDPAGAFGTFEDVLKVGRACDQARYMWYEDPFRGGGFSRFAHAKLRELIKTPMLMGEHVRGLEATADSIYAGATDFVRGDAYIDGGITGLMKMAALAEAHGLDVELHRPGLAHRHILANLRNANYYELSLVHPRIADTKPLIYKDRRWLDELDSVDENGCVEVPEGPGLGVEFDWDWIEDHKTGEIVYE